MPAALLALVLASPTVTATRGDTPLAVLHICPKSAVRLTECFTGQADHLSVVVAVCQDTHVNFVEVYTRVAGGKPQLKLTEKLLNKNEVYGFGVGSKRRGHVKTQSLEMTEFPDVDAHGNWKGKLTYGALHNEQVNCEKPKRK